MKKFRYKNIFMYSSLQFCGNIEEYFSLNTKKLLVFIVMPRLKNKYNLLRVYKNRQLVSEKRIWSSDNIFLYYFSWYFAYLYFLFTYYERNERFIIISSHPISFFGMTLQKLFRKITFVYFIGDYFPGDSLFIRMFETLKKHYHDRMPFAVYLSDGINKKLNGEIVNSDRRKTIMWGVKKSHSPKKIIKSNEQFTILFVGLIKDSQGLDFLFNFLREHKKYSVKIIGICNDTLYNKYRKMITKFKIENQVYFPNKFYSNNDLHKLANKCHVGVALYETGRDNPTYYTDPGKVKAYAEMGLPVIMTDISGVAPYIKKFHSGIVINREIKKLGEALVEMRKNYNKYIVGLEKFMDHFDYRRYYRDKYVFLENL